MSDLGTSASRRRVDDVLIRAVSARYGPSGTEQEEFSGRSAQSGVETVSVGLEFWLIPTDTQAPPAWTRSLWPHRTRFCIKKKKKKKLFQIKLYKLSWGISYINSRIYFDTGVANENKVVFGREIIIIHRFLSSFIFTDRICWLKKVSELIRVTSCILIIKVTQ